MLILIFFLLFISPIVYLVIHRTLIISKGKDISTRELKTPTNLTLQIYVQKSSNMFNRGLFDSCIIVCQEGLSLFPGDYSLLNNMAVAMIKTGRFFEAKEHLVKTLAMDNSFVLAKNNLKWCYDEITAVERKIQKRTMECSTLNNKELYYELGQLYYSIGKFTESITAYRKALLRDSSDATIYNNIGVSYMFQHKRDSALYNFSKAATIDTANILYQNNIQWTKEP
ncbi:MAG: tetratricopeptide repeat protein [Chitinispirillaceae bacterium]|nr:tetratricopeptide repeat protein [Chitinispirillaceae bacterium]